MSANTCTVNKVEHSIFLNKAIREKETKMKKSSPLTKIQSLVSSVSKRRSMQTTEVIVPKPSLSTARSTSQFCYHEQRQASKRHTIALIPSRSTPVKEKHVGKENSVARARSVLGLDSLKSRENRAIRVWKMTISQLTEQENRQQLEDLYPMIPPYPSFTSEQQVRHCQAMLQFILNEIIETEKSYNNLLNLIKHRYMQPMILASQSKDPLVKSTDIPILFNHLIELIQLSDKFIVQFEATKNIGSTFRSLEPDLVVFLKYAMHYHINLKTIKRACNNVTFIKIDQDNLSRRDTKRLGMSDYFIAPIQRIPRYCLLIKDLKKYTNPLDPDLNLAFKILTGLAVAMDSIYTLAP